MHLLYEQIQSLAYIHYVIWKVLACQSSLRCVKFLVQKTVEIKMIDGVSFGFCIGA